MSGTKVALKGSTFNHLSRSTVGKCSDMWTGLSRIDDDLAR